MRFISLEMTASISNTCIAKTSIIKVYKFRTIPHENKRSTKFQYNVL